MLRDECKLRCRGRSRTPGQWWDPGSAVGCSDAVGCPDPQGCCGSPAMLRYPRNQWGAAEVSTTAHGTAPPWLWRPPRGATRSPRPAEPPARWGSAQRPQRGPTERRPPGPGRGGAAGPSGSPRGAGVSVAQPCPRRLPALANLQVRCGECRRELGWLLMFYRGTARGWGNAGNQDLQPLKCGVCQ